MNKLLHFLLALCIFVLINTGVVSIESASAQKLNEKQDTSSLLNKVDSKQDPGTLFACPPPTFDYAYAVLYQHSNMGGYPLGLSCRNTDNTYAISNLANRCMNVDIPGCPTGTWNDNVSSIWVRFGCLIGWEHSNYGGGYIKLGAGNHTQVWNDVLSSVKWTLNACNAVAIEGDGELIYYDGNESVDIVPNDEIVTFKGEG